MTSRPLPLDQLLSSKSTLRLVAATLEAGPLTLEQVVRHFWSGLYENESLRRLYSNTRGDLKRLVVHGILRSFKVPILWPLFAAIGPRFVFQYGQQLPDFGHLSRTLGDIADLGNVVSKRVYFQAREQASLSDGKKVVTDISTYVQLSPADQGAKELNDALAHLVIAAGQSNYRDEVLGELESEQESLVVDHDRHDSTDLVRLLIRTTATTSRINLAELCLRNKLASSEDTVARWTPMHLELSGRVIPLTKETDKKNKRSTFHVVARGMSAAELEALHSAIVSEWAPRNLFAAAYRDFLHQYTLH